MGKQPYDNLISNCNAGGNRGAQIKRLVGAVEVGSQIKRLVLTLSPNPIGLLLEGPQ